MSGMSDEPAIDGHDLVHDAEVEEERLHEGEGEEPREADGGSEGNSGSVPDQ